MPAPSHADQLRQLALGIVWNAEATLDQYVPGPNADALAALRGDLGDAAAPLLLYGGRGSGKTHLLQAACRDLAADGSSYVPLASARDLSPELLQGLETLPLVALDDLQAVAGERLWEEAIFHLFNRLQARGGRLLMAGRESPAHLPLLLPDLVSRLQWGLVYRLQPLAEADMLLALQRRARQRGLELPHETAQYLLRRVPRDSHTLFDLLDVLDRAALAAQRRLTVPFVRQVLDVS